MRRWLSALSSTILPVAALAATIDGVVRDAVTGRPVSAARAELIDTGRSVRTDAAGAFALPHPETWPVTLVLSASGYRPERVVLTGPPPAALDVRLAPVVAYGDRVEVAATRAREGSDPASFTNVPRERLEEAYWAQDPALLLSEVVPGMYAYNDNGNGIGYSYFSIRGFGQARSRVTINGAPLNDAESGELFFIDLADFMSTAGDVQIKRGVYGLSGIGGAVDLATAPATVEPSFRIHLGAASYATRRLTARYDSGLIDGTWTLTARYSKVTSDGYRDQSWVDMWNYHLSLARLGERSQLRLILFGGPEQTHLAYEGITKETLEGGLTGDAARDRRSNPLAWPGEIDTFFQPHYQIVHEMSLTPRTQLAQTFYLFQGDGYYEQYRPDRWLYEYDLPAVVLPDGTTVEQSDLVRRRTVDEWDTGWTPTLTHREGPLSLSLTGELRIHRAHHFGEVRWAQYYPDGVEPDHRYYDYRVAKNSATIAGGAGWAATDALTLTGGLQFSTHVYEIYDDRLRGVAFDERYDFLLPRVGAVLRLADGFEAYAGVARGMREPAFRQIYDPQDYYGTRVSLDPEDVWDWEAGVSIRRPEWRVRANLFSMRFANEIVYAGALDDNGVPVYGNGAKSHHRGLEADASWTPTSRFGLDASLALSRNTFTDYREFGWDGGEVVYDGNRIAGFPDLLASLTARCEARGVRMSLTLRHVGKFYLDNSEDNRLDPEAREEAGYVPLVNPAFTALDLAATAPLPRALSDALGLGRLDAEARLNNAFDEEFTSFGYVDGGTPLFIPAAGRSVYVGLSLGL
jgi:iron complex outermembrane receptor protein